MGNCLIVRKGSQPEGTATASDVLSGVTFQSANSDELQTGTMTNNGAVVANVYAGDDYYIPKGYHDGSGHIKNASQLYYSYTWVQALETNEKWSEVCHTQATTTLHYAIICLAKSDTCYAKIEGSNDGTNWTVIDEIKSTINLSTVEKLANGYTQYRAYTKAYGSSQDVLYSYSAVFMSYII